VPPCHRAAVRWQDRRYATGIRVQSPQFVAGIAAGIPAGSGELQGRGPDGRDLSQGGRVTVYAVDKLISEARRLAAEYRRTTGKPLPGISAEIAENDAARLLDLEPVKDETLGYDAVGRGGSRQGKRIQIKSRTIFDDTKGGHRIGQLKTGQDWDSVLLVLMDEEYEPFEIYEAERDDLVAAVADSEGSKRAKRGLLSVAKFKIIGQLVWTREEGEIGDGVWDNRSER